MPHIGADSRWAVFGGIAFNVPNLLEWLFTPIQIVNFSEFMIQFGIKILTTALLGAVGAIAGVAAKDLYRYVKHKIKNK